MTTRRNKRQYVTPPVVLPDPPDMRRAKKLPMFGPGIVITVQLNDLPAYLNLYSLDVLPPQLPAHERIRQSVLYVKRMPKESK